MKGSVKTRPQDSLKPFKIVHSDETGIRDSLDSGSESGQSVKVSFGSLSLAWGL